MPNKKASSQAAYAILSEGVHGARVETHRIRHLLNRALKLVSDSKFKEHLYQIGGDIIIGLPNRLDNLEQKLDKVSYALSLLGKDFLEARLSITDKGEVEDAILFSQAPFGGAGGKKSMVDKVSERWVMGSANAAEAVNGVVNRWYYGAVQSALIGLQLERDARFLKIGMRIQNDLKAKGIMARAKITFEEFHAGKDPYGEPMLALTANIPAGLRDDKALEVLEKVIGTKIPAMNMVRKTDDPSRNREWKIQGLPLI